MGLHLCTVCEQNGGASDAPRPDDIEEEEEEKEQEDKPLANLSIVNVKKTIFVSEGDKYDKFEASLPFAQTYVSQFEAYVHAADKECGGEGFVTLEVLSKNFGSSAVWSAQFKDSESNLNKLLKLSAFKNEEKGHRAEQIDSQYLICLGLLLCASEGKDMHDKIKVLFGLLQDGGISAHTFISAADKDYPPIFEKLC